MTNDLFCIHGYSNFRHFQDWSWKHCFKHMKYVSIAGARVFWKCLFSLSGTALKVSGLRDNGSGINQTHDSVLQESERTTLSSVCSPNTINPFTQQCMTSEGCSQVNRQLQVGVTSWLLSHLYLDRFTTNELGLEPLLPQSTMVLL